MAPKATVWFSQEIKTIHRNRIYKNLLKHRRLSTIMSSKTGLELHDKSIQNLSEGLNYNQPQPPHENTKSIT